MKDFFTALIIVIMAFALCMVIAYAITVIKPAKKKKSYKKSTPPKSGGAKVYYVTDYSPDKPRADSFDGEVEIRGR